MFRSTHALFAIRPSILLMALLTLASCKKDDDDTPAPSNGGGGGGTGTTTLGYSHIFLDIQGPALSISETLSLNDVVDPDQLLMSGAQFQITDAEGLHEVIGLAYAYGFDKSVEMVIPAEIASNAMGSFVTTSTGIITETPTFHIKIGYAEAFYDNDGDGDNDILTDLLSTASTGVTVTNMEITSGPGIPTIDFLKGSFSGTMEMKVFVDPFTEPAIITHTVSGSFEFYTP